MGLLDHKIDQGLTTELFGQFPGFCLVEPHQWRVDAEGAVHAARQARARSTEVRVRLSAAGNNFNSAVRSPLTYLEIYDTTDNPFNATVERVVSADGTRNLDINGFGEFSTGWIAELKAGNRLRCVWADPTTGTINTGSTAEASEFQSSARYK